jgi:hypothetical protein
MSAQSFELGPPTHLPHKRVGRTNSDHWTQWTGQAVCYSTVDSNPLTVPGKVLLVYVWNFV